MPDRVAGQQLSLMDWGAQSHAGALKLHSDNECDVSEVRLEFHRRGLGLTVTFSKGKVACTAFPTATMS